MKNFMKSAITVELEVKHTETMNGGSWMQNNKSTISYDDEEMRQFETGAIRGYSEGRGRMDLLPWHGVMEVSRHCEEGAKKYGENNVDKKIPMHSLADSAMRHMAKFIAGHNDEDHLRAAAWNILWALEFRETMPELNDLYYWKGEDQCSETDAIIAE